MINTREESTIQSERLWSERLWNLFEARDFEGTLLLLKEHQQSPVSSDFHNDLKSDILFWGLKNKIESPWLWALFLEVTEQPHRIFDVLHTSLKTQQSFICQEPLFLHLFSQFSPTRQKQLLSLADPTTIETLWGGLNEEQQMSLWNTGFFTAHPPEPLATFLKEHPFKTVDAYLAILNTSNDDTHQDWKHYLFHNPAFQGFWDQFLREKYDNTVEQSLKHSNLSFFQRLLEEKLESLSVTQAIEYLKIWLNKQQTDKDDLSKKPNFSKTPPLFLFPSRTFEKLCHILTKKMSPKDRRLLLEHFKQSPLIKLKTRMYLPYKYQDLPKHLAKQAMNHPDPSPTAPRAPAL